MNETPQQRSDLGVRSDRSLTSADYSTWKSAADREFWRENKRVHEECKCEACNRLKARAEGIEVPE